jgi:hypothetical protein
MTLRTRFSLPSLPTVATRIARLLVAVLALAVTLTLVSSPVRAQQSDLLVNEFGPVSRYNTTTKERVGYLVSPEPDPVGGMPNYSWGFTFGPDGLLYVSDFFAARVLRYEQDPSYVEDPTGGTTAGSFRFKDVFLEAGTNGLSPGLTAIAFGPDGNFYVSAGKDGGYEDIYSTLFCFDGKTAAPVADFPSLSGIDLVFGVDGTYAANWWESSVERLRVIKDPLTNTWQMTRDVIIAPGDNGLAQPRQIAFGPDGDLYVTSEGTGDVKRYHNNGASWQYTGDVAVGSGAVGVAFGPSDGCLYTLGSGQILRYPGPNYDVPEVFAEGVDGSKLLFDRFRTQTGSSVEVSPLPTASITFSAVTAPGITTVTPLESATGTFPANFQTATATGAFPTFFDVHTTATFSGTAELSFAYDPAQFPYDPVSNPSGDRPALLHYENGAWTDVTTRIDTATHKVYGQVSSFSPFAIGKRLYYSWSGFQAPINADGTSVFKQGSTVAVKFRLTGIDKANMNLVARLNYARIADDGSVGEVNQATSTAAASAGNAFRYDPSTGQYVFNLGTKTMPTGKYQLSVDMGDGLTRTVEIGLKK